jgi:hypothetical protein
MKRFVGGMAVTSVSGCATCVGNISDVDESKDGKEAYIRRGWTAKRHGDAWLEHGPAPEIMTLRQCSYDEGVGADKGVGTINWPHRDTTITLYPKDHPRVIKREDLRPIPHPQFA